MRTLINVPTYCEVENISELLRGIRSAMPAADVLVIDDASSDGTADLARHLGQDLGQITVLDRPHKMGLGEAYRAGFTWGLDRGYDVLVEMDADLSHDPATLPQLVRAIARGAALAIGSRYVDGGSIPNWTWRRRWLSRWGNRYAGLALGLPILDTTSGYRAYAADALGWSDYQNTRANGYAFQIELTRRVARVGPVVEVPIAFSDRKHGDSKMSLKITSEALLLVTMWGLSDRVRGRRRRTAPNIAAS